MVKKVYGFNLYTWEEIIGPDREWLDINKGFVKSGENNCR